jgi:hypothetical protein
MKVISLSLIFAELTDLLVIAIPPLSKSQRW